ncbi:MAG: RES family NAD+ phosphorylase [Verrucomicrobiota bacterium]
MVVWRIVKTRYANSAFNGEGAERYGGRWNSMGVPAVYAAESRALAILELLVHASGLLPAYALISADIPDNLIEHLPQKDVPSDWRTQPHSPGARHLGDRWLRSDKDYPVLCVPSAIVPEEKNYLLDPRHPRFGELRIGKPTKTILDRRLKR